MGLNVKTGGVLGRLDEWVALLHSDLSTPSTQHGERANYSGVTILRRVGGVTQKVFPGEGAFGLH